MDKDTPYLSRLAPMGDTIPDTKIISNIFIYVNIYMSNILYYVMFTPIQGKNKS